MNKYEEAYKITSNLTPRDLLDKKVREAVDLVKEACDKAKKYDEINRVYLKNEVMESADINAERLQQLYEDMQQFIDKATPKKPIERPFESKKHFKICPSCWEKDIKTFVYGNYCEECGQRLE